MSLLQDFSHPALEHRTFACPLWDLRNFLQIKAHLGSLSMDSHQRDVVETTVSNFEKYVQPLLSSFSQGALHGDISVQNIVVQKKGDEEKFGIIDFGDCMHNCHLFELATAIHGFLTRGNIEHDIHVTAPLVAGYTCTFPLSSDELGCLYYAVLARMCVAAVATEMNLQADPSNGYLRDIVQQSWRAAQVFFNHPKPELDKLWIRAINKEAKYH